MNLKKDFLLVALIGLLVGVLSQPILANVIVSVQKFWPASEMAIRVAVFFFFLILAPVALLLAYLVSKAVKVVYQIAKYAAVGSLNSFINLGVFNLETLMLGSTPSELLFAVFKTVSFLVATTNSYFWNKYWTFGAGNKPDASEVSKFFGVQVVGVAIDVGMSTLVFALGVHSGITSEKVWTNLVSPICGFLTAFIWNYIGNKYIVFKGKEAQVAIEGNNLTNSANNI